MEININIHLQSPAPDADVVGTAVDIAFIQLVYNLWRIPITDSASVDQKVHHHG